MDIIVELVGPTPTPRRVIELRDAIAKSYQLHIDAFDAIVAATPQRREDRAA